MAPTVTSAVTFSKEQLTFTNKIRKPLVEKMRRDRINNSIEQLKSLLVSEIRSDQPDSKLEKADILEMAVCFLRQLQHLQSMKKPSEAASQGFSRCVQETVHFLSREDMKTQIHQRLLNQFQSLQPPCDKNRKESVLPQLNSPVQLTNSKEKSPVTSSLWRPW
ncbi:transcription factor HES-5-like [Denticeps clupeoides]|uniref:Transcription factor HES-5 n=1 Tax=Denticeps clupeoides TaxID=299321 RepID=A0AAY4C964_9TELE|nr:transcription factor HES-5-like [Denticeps clupeoides]